MKSKFFILCLALMCATHLLAYDAYIDGIYYDLNKSAKTAEVTTQSGIIDDCYQERRVVVIPSTITYNSQTYSVTTIGDIAFYDCSGLTSVTIPNSVTTIGDLAFAGCSGLTSVTIPNSVTMIGNDAFYGVSNIVYSGTATGSPWGAKCVNGYADGYWVYSDANKTKLCGCFTAATGAITIPNSVTTIGERAFYDCSGLTSVTIPNSVTTIGEYAFYNCRGLKSVTISNSVTTIGEGAFYGCSSLTSVTIPNSVTTIGSSAFIGCNRLTKTNYTGTIADWCKIKFGSSDANPMYDSHNFYINDVEVKDLVILDGVDTIGRYAFYECSGLTSVTIGNSVTTIGNSAFRDCSGLTSVTIGNSVTTIGNSAFYECSGLKTVYNGSNLNIVKGSLDYGYVAYYADKVYKGVLTGDFVIKDDTIVIGYFGTSTNVAIPDGITAIGEETFCYCSSLTSITCNAIVPPTCESNCFYNVSKSIPVYVPILSMDAYKQANEWKDFNRYFSIEEVSVSVNDSAFGSVQGGGHQPSENVTITATANYGYHFVQWNDGNTDNLRSFVLTQDTSFTALFAKNIYTITVNGTHGIATGGGVYEYLSSVQISAAADEHYHFVKWSDGNTNNPRTVSVTGDKTYTAIFALDQHTVSAKADYGNVSGIGTYNYGSEISLTVTPSYGYLFAQWSDGNTDNPRSFVLTQDTSFTAQFDKNTYTISTAVNDNQRGMVQGGKSALYLDEITLTAIPNYGYHFTKWSDGNTDNPRRVTVKENKTYTAQFDKNQYVVTTNKGEHIQSIVGAGTYDYLDEVTLSATAETYYRFDHWSDGNTDNPRSFVVTQDTTFTAISAKITSGKCGDNLRWNYNDGVLVISGTGTMYDYTQGKAPWMPMFKDSISSLVINNGCTSIGNFAFYGLSNKNLKTIDLPNSINQIGQYAFANCEYLKNLYLGLSLEKIAANAFANDERLLYVTCYAIEPPLLDESAFANYDAYLSVPCESQADYKVSKGWKLFNKENVSCIGAEEKSVATDEVIVAPEASQATFTWPQNEQAAGYSIEITKDSVVFCTLKFNAQGQLTGIAFAPSRGGQAREMPAAMMTANGWQFTVTGLNQASKYGYTLDALNASQQSIKHYEGEFATDGYVGLYTLPYEGKDGIGSSTKIIKDNRLLILHNGNLYHALGGKVR